jgi:hypothetical protein
MTFSVLLMVSLTAPTLWATVKQPNKNTTVAGSGEKYTTTVSSETKGQISPEDLRQVSLLTSQVLRHVSKAEQSIELGNSVSANAEIKEATNLIEIAHKLLPVKLVTTTVKDAKGTEVYNNTETTQEDVIPLYQVAESIDTFNEILNFKKAELEGKEYLGSINLNATMLVDLGYVERKVQYAMQLIDDNQNEKAKQQLLLAKSYGVDVRFSEAENPLVDAQKAFNQAEKMVHDEKYDATIMNLNVAKIKLQEYAELAGESKADEAQQLRTEIDKLVGNIKEKGAFGKIHALWHKTTGLFERHPSQVNPSVHKTVNGETG